MSVEAFAMAGMDYKECGINHSALEKSFKAKPENNFSFNSRVDKSYDNSSSLDYGIGMEWMKMKMREWATAVVSNNATKADLTVSEIVLIMDNHIVRGKRDNFS